MSGAPTPSLLVLPSLTAVMVGLPPLVLTGILPAVNVSLLVASSALSGRPKGQAGGDGSSKQLHSLEQLSSHRLGLGPLPLRPLWLAQLKLACPVCMLEPLTISLELF